MPMWLGKVAPDAVSVFQEGLNIQGGKWVRLQKEKASPNVSIASKCWFTNAGVLGG